MEAHSTQALNGIARSMAPAGLKKALSFEAVTLASQERVQQRPPLRPRAADGGSVGGSAEDGVSSEILRRTVGQIVNFLAPVIQERISARTDAIEVPKVSCQSPRAMVPCERVQRKRIFRILQAVARCLCTR